MLTLASLVAAVIDNKAFVASSVVSEEGGDRVVSLWSREKGKVRLEVARIAKLFVSL